MEGVIAGYHGDIAISDASLAISDSCSFAPNEAKQNASGRFSHLNAYMKDIKMLLLFMFLVH